MVVNIKETEVTLKNTFRSMIMYENIMDKTFIPNSITEILVYFYCVILASEKGIELLYEDFLDWVDVNPKYVEEFVKWVIANNKQQEHIKKK